MWLTSDERRLLTGYVNNIDLLATTLGFQKIDCGAWYDKDRLVPLVKCGPQLEAIPELGRNEPRPQPEATLTAEVMKKWFADRKLVDEANLLLAKRGLIHELDGLRDEHHATIKLTLEGYLLGKKLMTWHGRCDEWYQAHKNGLIGVGFSIFFGIVGGFLSHWMIPK